MTVREPKPLHKNTLDRTETLVNPPIINDKQPDPRGRLMKPSQVWFT